MQHLFLHTLFLLLQILVYIQYLNRFLQENGVQTYRLLFDLHHLNIISILHQINCP